MKAENRRPAKATGSRESIDRDDDQHIISLGTSNLRDFPGLTVEQSTIVHLWLADSYNVPADRLAFVALVEVGDGKYRRRPYLTLAAAQAAVERAEARGVVARIGLFELRPLGGGS